VAENTIVDGRYRITGRIGAGGMADVYCAHDEHLGRDVALKMLPSAVVADPERIARFEREAKTLASLNHPHIAQIYGLEESGGTRFLIMELVDGETLAARLERGPVPIPEALALAAQIAAALEAAHERGIVHRDLKPANIAVAADGAIKVLDCGIGARQLADDHVAGDDDRCRRDPRNRGVHVAGAGARPGRRPARRHLGVRLRALRDAGRPRRVYR
jgi:serine/threonine protein kinase